MTYMIYGLYIYINIYLHIHTHIYIYELYSYIGKLYKINIWF